MPRDPADRARVAPASVSSTYHCKPLLTVLSRLRRRLFLTDMNISATISAILGFQLNGDGRSDFSGVPSPRDVFVYGRNTERASGRARRSVGCINRVLAPTGSYPHTEDRRHVRGLFV